MPRCALGPSNGQASWRDARASLAPGVSAPAQLAGAWPSGAWPDCFPTGKRPERPESNTTRDQAIALFTPVAPAFLASPSPSGRTMRHRGRLLQLAALLLLAISTGAQAKAEPGPGKCHPQCTKYGYVTPSSAAMPHVPLVAAVPPREAARSCGDSLPPPLLELWRLLAAAAAVQQVLSCCWDTTPLYAAAASPYCFHWYRCRNCGDFGQCR